jgi:type IV secretory pathway VirB4 component
MQGASQQFLPVAEIKEGVILLKNGGLRGVLMVSSINFALKSSDEQQAIIYQFQNFLNSLDFTAQILVQSRRVNMTGYLEKLKKIEARQTNDLIKAQTSDYRRFINDILERGDIMSKSFYVVVPYTLAEVQGTVSAAREILKRRDRSASAISADSFKRARSQLLQRMEFVAIGLRRCELEAVPLTSPELIEMLWALHHPDSAEQGYYPSIMPEIIE